MSGPTYPETTGMGTMVVNDTACAIKSVVLGRGKIHVEARWPVDHPTPPPGTYGVLILGADRSQIVRHSSFINFSRRPNAGGCPIAFDLTIVDGITDEVRYEGGRR